MEKFTPYAKSFVAALVAGLSVIATSLDNNELNAQEIVYAAIAFFTGLGAVYAIPNRDPRGLRQQDSVQPPERGAIDLGTAIALAILVVLLLVLIGALR